MYKVTDIIISFLITILSIVAAILQIEKIWIILWSFVAGVNFNDFVNELIKLKGKK